jgi:hypothetical protein
LANRDFNDKNKLRNAICKQLNLHTVFFTVNTEAYKTFLEQLKVQPTRNLIRQEASDVLGFVSFTPTETVILTQGQKVTLSYSTMQPPSMIVSTSARGAGKIYIDGYIEKVREEREREKFTHG